MVYTHFEPRNTNGWPWTWVRKPLFRSLKSVSRTCSQANIMRGIVLCKHKNYIFMLNYTMPPKKVQILYIGTLSVLFFSKSPR